MKSQIFNIFLAILVCGSIVFAAHSIPPLTQPTAPSVAKHVNSRAANFNAVDFCASALSGVDCGCFSQKAAEILSTENDRVMGFAYANPIDLAISQGQESCSGT
ncbi:hypothetical protein C8N36_11258 [Pelagimonas varians]|uniref:Uncharacterized protein n=2 Tax=Pelagimonas varians TaxID=696760 RepID=A0A238KUC6_9RHOB|nr:hypothetical protein [Pelagimonas varians]PYG28283.1 hypothetical protein C8N36_11258 [Pelagimonas varians]SMX46385.1 hypothetical protein PEV8663_03260 [Pelagimonas varians]